MSRLKILAVAVPALALTLTGCGAEVASTGGVTTSGQTYDSANTVALDSELTLHGTLSATPLHRAQDDGGNASSGVAFPVALYEFTVHKTSSGENPGVVRLLVDDYPQGTDMDGLPQLEGGKSYVVMAVQVTPPTTSSIAEWGTVWRANDHGVFDVEGDNAVPQSEDLPVVIEGEQAEVNRSGEPSAAVTDLLKLPTG